MQTALLVLKNSGIQFLFIFGSVLIAGLVLTWISRWTQNVFAQFKFPNFGLYVFGIVGVPIHELCHAIFAKLFLHEIKKVKWFDPKGKGGSNGYVAHTYNENHFFHRLGLFFIGMGPVLLAPFLLYAVYHGLVPASSHFDFSILKPAQSLQIFGSSLIHTKNWSSVGFYVFLYLTVCITSQMELSPEDMKVARGGILHFYSLFLVANLISHFAGFNLHSSFMNFFNTTFIWFIGFFALAIVVAFLNLMICYLAMNFLNKISGAESINPFKS